MITADQVIVAVLKPLLHALVRAYQQLEVESLERCGCHVGAEKSDISVLKTLS